MQNNINDIKPINISSPTQITETATSSEDQKLKDKIKDIYEKKNVGIKEVNKKYEIRIKDFSTSATATYKDIKNENNITIPLQQYYNNVVSRVREFMLETNDLINIYNSFRSNEAKEKEKENVYGDEKFLKEKLELYEKLFSMYECMKDLVNFYVDFFNKIKNEDTTEPKQIDVNDFEIKFSEKLNIGYKENKEFKEALEEYRVKRNHPIPEEEDLIFYKDIEKYGEYLKNSEKWFNTNVKKLKEAYSELKKIYADLNKYLFKENEEFIKNVFSQITDYVDNIVKKSGEKSSELFENGECKKGKKKKFISFLKDVEGRIDYINNPFTKFLKENSYNFKKGQEFKTIYKAKDEDSKLNNIAEEKELNTVNLESIKNINKLIKKINEKFNTSQKNIPNGFNLSFKKESKKDELLKKLVLKEVDEDYESFTMSPSEYYDLFSNRIKKFITNLNLLIKKWNYYAEQAGEKFGEEKLEINKNISKLCEDLNSIIEFYLNYFNYYIKKINTNKNYDVSEFENEFSEKLDSLKENLVDLENKLEELRISQNLPFIKNDKLKSKQHFSQNKPFDDYTSFEEPETSSEDEDEYENKNFYNNENENVILYSIENPAFEKNPYARNVLNFQPITSEQNSNLSTVFKNFRMTIAKIMKKFYRNLLKEKISIKDVSKEIIDEINNNSSLNAETKKAEIRDVENILNQNKDKNKKINVIDKNSIILTKAGNNFLKKHIRNIICRLLGIFKNVGGANIVITNPNITKEEEGLRKINKINADTFIKNDYNYENIPSGFLYKLFDIDDIMNSVGINKEELELFKKSEFYKPEVVKNIKDLISMAETKKLYKEDIEILVKAIEKYKYIFREFVNIKDKNYVNEKGEITSVKEKLSAESYKNEFKKIIKEIEKSITQLIEETKIREKNKSHFMIQ